MNPKDFYNKPFTGEKHRKASKEDYLGNECGSDEYHESQPEKGLRHIGNAIFILAQHRPNYIHLQLTTQQQDRLFSDYCKLVKGLKRWVAMLPNDEFVWYEGGEELKEVLAVAYDVLWDNGEHPYFDTPEELLEGEETI